jgi:hypothetical protein
LFELPLGFGKAFVIRNLRNKGSNILAKCFSNQFSWDFGILDGIMQQRSYYQVRIGSTGRIGHEHCDFDQMIDIGLLGGTLGTWPAERRSARLRRAAMWPLTQQFLK